MQNCAAAGRQLKRMSTSKQPDTQDARNAKYVLLATLSRRSGLLTSVFFHTPPLIIILMMGDLCECAGLFQPDPLNEHQCCLLSPSSSLPSG